MNTSGTRIALAGVARPSLIRAIGRWSLTAAVINCVIGSGIFGLPSVIAGLVGVWSPVAVLFAGCSIFIIVLCFAEVGSRFEDAGGPYLYARDAFGPAVGFQVGWLHLWTRVLSGAAILNIFVQYLGAIVPAVQAPVGRAVAMTAGVALVTANNITGVRNATWAVNVFTVAKLLPLLLLIILGAFHLRPEVFATQVVSIPNWPEALLLLVFAYGGFESAVVAASETRNPRGDTAFALITAMAAVTVVYCGVQLAILGVLPHAAQSATPVSSALGELLGATGSGVGSLAVVVSVYGWLTGFALLTPRILLSMANRSEVPAIFGSVHPRFRTPHISIATNSAIVLVLGLFSSFTQAATLAAIARLGIFVFTCAALIKFRRQAGEPSGFRLPGGRAVAFTGIAFCLWLLSTRSLSQSWILLAIMASGALLWAGGRHGWFILGAAKGAGDARP